MSNLNVAFWNLQNLFDTSLSAIAADLGYTPENGWTEEAKNKKIENLASIINEMFDGAGPDLLGICEIENISVINELIAALDRDDLVAAHVDSPDIRGIDCSLIYSKNLFEKIGDPVGHLIHLRYPTRDVFEVKLKVKSNDSELVVLVNHWPSRSIGRLETEPYRITVASQCGKIIDEHLKFSKLEYMAKTDSKKTLKEVNERWNKNVLVMGDFNDEPYDTSLMYELQASSGIDKIEELLKKGKGRKHTPTIKSYLGKKTYLFNCSWSKLGMPDVGTHYYSQSINTMNMLDQLIISRGLLYGESGLLIEKNEIGIPKFEIYAPKKMWTSANSGRPKKFEVKKKSNGTFQIKGGYSDHFPIYSSIEIL